MTKNYVTPTEVGSYNLRNPIMLIPTLIPHFAIQVYYKGLFNEEDGLQPLLLLITINNFCNMYFHLQTSELLSGKAFNSISDILHFDVRNVSLMTNKQYQSVIVGLTQFLSPNIAQTLSVRGKNQYDY